MRWGLVVGVPVVAAAVVLAAHPWPHPSGVGRNPTILSPVAAAPLAASPGRAASAARPTPAQDAPAQVAPGPTHSVIVPACGAQLCQVPGTNVFAEPGTVYDPATGRTRAIPPLSPSYRAHLCRVEHVNCS